MKQYKCKRIRFIEAFKENKDLFETIQIENTSILEVEDWMEKYSWFRTEIQNVMKSKIVYIEHVLLEMIKKGNIKAAELYLKNAKDFNIFKTDTDIKDDNSFYVKVSEEVFKSLNK